MNITVIDAPAAHFTEPNPPPAPFPTGDGSTIMWIPVSTLQVDHRYQRPLAIARANQIAIEFDNAAIGLLSVNQRRDGTFWIYDGQTRCEALRLRGHRLALCRVVHNLSEREESRAFVNCNKIRGMVAALYLFKAEVAFGDPVALQVQDLLEHRGIIVRDYARAEDESPVIAAIATLQLIVRRQGLDVLEKTLDVIQQAWPGYDRDAYARDTLRAIAAILVLRSNHIDAEALASRLQNTTVAQLRARGHILAEGTRWYTITSLANAMLEHWNRTLSSRVTPVPYLGRA